MPICSFVGVAHAQAPQAAAAASVAASAPEPILPRGQTPPDPLAADDARSGDFVHRYAPQANLWEAGVFLGPLFTSDENSFRGPTVVNPGLQPTVMPVSTFEQPSIEIGTRGGYFPLSFLGAELEGMVALAQSDAGNGVTVLAARLHAVAQLSYWSIVPFAVVGVGYWSALNDVSGNDSDPAFHFGGGAKVNIARSRIEFRIIQ